MTQLTTINGLSDMDSLPGRIRSFDGFLLELERAETPDQGWLRANSAAIRRAHAEMLAEREEEGARDAA